MKSQDSKLQDKKEVRDLARLAFKVIEDKKLEDIVILELREDSGLADYFIIATASSSPQMKAGIDAVYKAFKDEHIHPYGNSENSMDSLWSLIDYGFLVVHIFTKEGREFYELDKLWHECKRVDFNNDTADKLIAKIKEEKNKKEIILSDKEVKKEIKLSKIKKELKSKTISKKDKLQKAIDKKVDSKKSLSKPSSVKKAVGKKSVAKKTNFKKVAAKKTISKKSLAKKTIKKLSKKTPSNK